MKMPLRSYDIKRKSKKTEDSLRSKDDEIKLFDCGTHDNKIDHGEVLNHYSLKRKRESSSSGPTLKHGRAKDLQDLFERYFQYTNSKVEEKIYHSRLPSFNLNYLTVDDCADLQAYPSFSFSAPKPIYIASRHSPAFDICKRRSFLYNAAHNRLLRAANVYKNTSNRIRDLRQLEKEHKYHRGLFDFAVRLEQDPDNYFYGSHDYYYSGGSLCVLAQDYIVHVDGENLENLNISQFPYVNSKTCSTLEQCSTNVFNKTSEIFEVKYFPIQHDMDKIRLTLRQRTAVTLCSWNPKDNQLDTLVEFKSKNTAFISTTYSPIHPNKILISNMKQQVRLYDINYEPPVQTAIYHHNDEEMITSWNTIKHWQDSNFLFANQNTLNILDIRTSADKWLKQTFCKPKSTLECDAITALTVSSFDNLVYVATSHGLYCLDLRKHNNNLDLSGSICCWTHMIDYAPIHISTIQFKNIELIAMAGPFAGDVRICELSRKGFLNSSDEHNSIYKSTCLPYQPPTIQEAYDSARIAGKCLEPKADLKRRIRNFNIGLQFYKYEHENNGKTTFLLTANSIGDVFAHTLIKREKCENEFAGDERITKKSIKHMTTYSKDIIETVPGTLNYTAIANLKTLRKIFGCETLSNYVKEAASDQEIKPEKKRNKFGRWQKSIQSLHNYKDALVKDLLEIWDIECEKEYSIHFKDEKYKKKPDNESFVNEWLHKSCEEPPMTSVPIANISRLSTFEVDVTSLDVSQPAFNETSLADAPQSTQIYVDVTGLSSVLDDTMLTNLEKSTPCATDDVKKIKTKVKKRKYVKGFA